MYAEAFERAVPAGLVEIDLTPVLRKLALEGEAVNGEPIAWDVADLAYRRFLTLRKRYPEQTLVPSAVIDAVWHYHILDSRKYMSDCDRIFGRYLHHDPYFGLGGDEDRLANEIAWEETRQIWEKEFGEPMVGEAHRCSSKDCR